ncbi:unnamed protein product [Bursaphelenchus okinawaensis]|uniref:Bacterial surface antigen (D15) domain-containing protein n=1 Tax=Bursaphelenchus okinawaensis TaxID=465554 RepID=A0A811KMJ7_9BILA|nr:unnamed protein product [Bursaphelenchus okinawaensis]CAG9106715.1 unnamed protein product [Bursaphelenchus okinawaensis]
MSTYHLAQVIYGQTQNQKCVLTGIRFDNVSKTEKDALIKETGELYNSRNLNELIVKSHMAGRHMQDVGLMERCATLIEKTPGLTNGYNVRFIVKEPKKVVAGVKMGVTSTGTVDGSLTASKGSLLGRGETADVSYSSTIKGSHTFTLNFIKPWLGWQVYKNSGVSLRRVLESLPWNQSNLTENALVLQHGQALMNKKLYHLLKLNFAWRTLLPTEKSAFSIREHAGHTTKISVENVLQFDNRDRPILPSTGATVRLMNEIASFLGDSSFFRSELLLQAATKLPLGCFLSGSINLQAVQNIGNRTLHVLDRVYLGGSQDVRGFEINSIGPRSDNSVLGGTAAAAFGAHLFLPLYPKDVFYAHAFTTGGTVAAVRSREWISDMSETMRVTAGLGITAVLKNVIRFELSYVVPLAHVGGDRCESGVYFGAGTSFL